MDDLIEEHFLRHGLYRLPGGGSPKDFRQEALPDILYRYELLRASDDVPVTLQAYRGVSGPGGLLWEQEMKTLLRVGMLRHAALPEVIDGGHRATPGDAHGNSPGFAFVVTRGSGMPLVEEPQAVTIMRANPVESLRQLSLLADALARLHDLGIVHRNLWPGTIEVTGEGEGSALPEFRLVRFEMSRMVQNLLQAEMAASVRWNREVRHSLIARDPRALAFYAPERIRLLFPEGAPAEVGESERSDVYGLGVTAYEWFFGPVPFDAASLDLSDHARVREVTRALNERMRRDVRRGESTLGAKLRKVLESMLTPDPRFRPRAGEIAADIDENYSAMIELWTAKDSGTPSYLVAFMPQESVATVKKWEWIERPPASPEGRRELAAFIEGDLKRARLAYSPQGAVPFVVAGEPEAKLETKYALVGERGIWFCKRYQRQTPFGTPLGKPSETILLIKYVIPLDRREGRGFLERLAGGALVRNLPGIEAVSSDTHPRELDQAAAGRPSWLPLLDAVRPRENQRDIDQDFELAFDWLLEYQAVELAARQYPFQRVGEAAGRTVTLLFDEELDRRRTAGSAMLSRFSKSRRRRPGFADFFADLATADGDTTLEARADTRLTEQADPEPGHDARHIRRSSRIARVAFKKRETDDAIVVERLDDSPPIPERGWLSLAEDQGSWVALHRQTDAKEDFLDNRLLLRQLLEPTTIQGLPHRWEGAGEGLLAAGKEAVTTMLSAEPFFALQGPPGTGKTEVAARAVKGFLTEVPAGRVLTTAQSNFALDNLAIRILQRMGVLDHEGRLVGETADIIPMRLQSAAALSNDRVDSRLGPFELHVMAERRKGRVQQKVREDLAARREGPRELLGEWVRTLDTCVPELAGRLARAANLVFATCATATAEALGVGGSGAMFERVIIEEAAKAWPTELAIPLARGRHWTLIGDHHQLPPHRRREIVRFLQDCAGDDRDELALHGQRSDRYLRIFDLFSHLFTQDDAPGGMTRPAQTLTQQFRMRRPIADLVSRVFYPVPDSEPDETGLRPGQVESPRDIADTTGLAEPAWLVRPALMWLDTTGVPGCRQAGTWYNDGEAAVVANLLDRMRPAPPPPGETPLTYAILTPYRQQADRLRRHGAVARHDIATVHAFQGREADIVVVSLVRDRTRIPGQALSNFGHLTERQLINVMLSRARRLLVIVGSFAHFQQGEDFWPEVCRGVEVLGERRPVPGELLS
jgi:hypothetical protein